MASETGRRIGLRIRQRRTELGLTQKQLAARMRSDAVDKQRISDWERAYNHPSDRYLEELVEALAIPDVSYFYEPDPEPEPEPERPRETPDPFRANGNGNGHATIDDVLAEIQAMRADTKKRYDALDIVLRAILGYWQAARGETKPLPTTLAESQALLDWAQEQERIALQSRDGEDRRAESG